MNKILAFAKLDFVTVRPFFTLKNLLPLIFAALVLNLTSGGGGIITAFLVVFFVVMFATYPFAVGEQNGIDALYCTLSVSREHVVGGRYLYALCLDVLGAAASLALVAVIRALGPLTGDLLSSDPLDIGGQLIALITVVFALSIVQAFQLPIYFKLGYAKAKFLAYMPFILFSAIVGAATFVFEDGFEDTIKAVGEFFGMYTVAAVLIMFGVWLGAMFVSYLLSLRLYKKREF